MRGGPRFRFGRSLPIFDGADRVNIQQVDSGAGGPRDRQPRSARFLHFMRDSWRAWLLGLFVVAGAGVIFLEIADEVLEGERLRGDARIMLAIHQLSAPWLDKVMLTISWIGYPGVSGLVIAAVLWLWWRELRAEAVALLVSFAGASFLSQWLKMLFERPRPAVFTPVIAVGSYSFPSGHVMNSIGFYGFVAYLLWRHRRRGWAVLSLLFILLVAFSRVYLGVHYPSDIIGAFTIATVWVMFVITGYHIYCRRGKRVQAAGAAVPAAEGEGLHQAGDAKSPGGPSTS
jgi:membrane-associated phospholipid phosphatase